jgi:ankyrin repeat protein
VPTISICKPRYTEQDLRLLEAARRGDADRTTALLGEGLDVNDNDVDGVTALIMASMAGKLEVVEVLIRAGAKLEPKDSLGYNAYEAAMFYGDFKGITVEPFDKIMELVKID